MNYLVRLFDLNGCLVEAPVQLRVDTRVNYYIPSAFTPNIDGVNDRFWVYTGKGVKGIQSIEIFNRWGDRVYQIKAPDIKHESQGWNGTFKGKSLDPDVFIYKVQLELTNGKLITETGSLTLLK